MFPRSPMNGASISGHSERAAPVARNTLYNLLGQVLPLLVALVSIPYVVRGLGPERFGLLSLAWVVLGYFTLFDLGLGRATTKYVAELVGRGEEQRVSEVVWTSLAFQLGFGLLGAAVLFLVTPFLVERVLHVPPELAAEARQAFTVLSLGVPVVLASSSLLGALEGRQRFDLVNAVRIPASAGTYLLPALGVVLQADLAHIVLLIIAWRAAAATILLWVNWRTAETFRATWPNRALARQLIGFGAWVTLSNLVIPLFVYLDRFLIGSLLTLTAAAYYTISYELVSRALILPSSFANALFPVLSMLFARRDRDRLNSVVIRTTKHLIIMMVPVAIVLIIFADTILSGWLGDEFASASAATFRFLSLAVLLNAIGYIPFAMVEAYGRPDVIAKYHLVELPVYVSAAVVLIIKLGITGAALAWFLRMGWTIPIFFAICAKTSGVNVGGLLEPRMSSTLVISALFLVVSMYLGNRGNTYLLATVASTCTLLFAYVIILWFLSLDDFDKSLGRSLLGHLRHMFLKGRDAYAGRDVDAPSAPFNIGADPEDH